MERTALIGFTGFVGSTLLQTMRFDATYNSKNISDIQGKEFDLIVCAGAPAAKWIANREPEADWANIEMLIDNLAAARSKHMVLVSTVDVYSNPVGVTEGDEPDLARAEPYGKHRRLLEMRVAEMFPGTSIMRLPALFGLGLKKNILFDLLNDNMIEKINPGAIFQWYPMRRLSDDIMRVLSAGVPLVNIAVEPIATQVILDEFFPDAIVGPTKEGIKYDMRTNQPEILGGEGAYHINAQTVISELADFFGELS